MLRLSAQEARRLAVRAQRLDRPPPRCVLEVGPRDRPAGARPANSGRPFVIHELARFVGTAEVAWPRSR